MLSVIVAASNQRRIYYTGLRTFQVNKIFRHKNLRIWQNFDLFFVRKKFLRRMTRFQLAENR